MVKYILNFILLIITLSACNDTPHYSEELLRLESRVGEAPDSVFCTLDSINSEMMTEADRALFINIKTEAADKLYKEHTTDSLIAEARTFFEKNNDMTRLAKAWYLTGRIHSDWEEWAMATEDFLKAKELTENSTDLILRGRIASFLGKVNWMNRLYSHAQVYYKEAYNYYSQSQDTLRMAYTIKEIGETYMANYQTDSAIYMYQQALKLAKTTKEQDILIGIHNRLGYMYREINDYKLALIHLHQALKLSDYKSFITYNNIGKLYLLINKPDSARFYLEMALKSSSLPILCMSNYYLGELSKMEGKNEDAYYYLKKYESLSDSLDRSKHTNNIITLQQKYKEEHLNKKYTSLIRYKNLLIISLITLFMTIFISSAYIIRGKKILIQKKIKKLVDTIRENEILIRNIQKEHNNNPENTTIKEQIEFENQKLLKQFNNLNIERCKKNKFLKKLYGNKKEMVSNFNNNDWAEYDEAFHSIYPIFTESLKKSFPKLSEQEIRICQLSVMGVKTSKIADVFLLQSDTISSYKQKIKKSCFPNKVKTLEELLLYFIVN